jgi:hypothetical protein
MLPLVSSSSGRTAEAMTTQQQQGTVLMMSTLTRLQGSHPAAKVVRQQSVRTTGAAGLVQSQVAWLLLTALAQ